MRGEDAGAAAGVLFCVPRVRRAVRAQEEAGIAARGGFDQRDAIGLGLQHRQAVVMRANAACEDRCAIEQQVLRRDGRANPCARTAHELHGLLRGDVLEHDAQLGKTLHHRLEHLVYEPRLAIEHIHVLMSHLTMNL
jgi:hypothetical protein